MTEPQPQAESGFAHLGGYLRVLQARASLARQKEIPENANAECIQSIRIRGKEGSGEPLTHGAVDNDDHEQFAHYLAMTFDDTTFRNLAFYRLVAKLPRHVVLDALQRAKDAKNIKKSRAHLFAFIVREHLPRRSQGLTNEP